jgi:hypothetical protein
MGMVVEPRVELLRLNRDRAVGVDDVSLFISAALGVCGRDGGRQSAEGGQTQAGDAVRVHTCDDCDTGSMLSVGGGVSTTGVVASGVCDIEDRQVRAVSRQGSDGVSKRGQGTPEATTTRS